MIAAHKSESPGATGLHATNQNSPADFTADQKRLATLKAQLACVGHEVYEMADGGLLVTRWGMSRHCPDLRTLVAFARQIGALK